jgi:lipopolysaccharide biosynthesis glycosyltransferase
MINLTVGFDPRESIAYHVFCQSLISRSSQPVAITPLALNNLKGYHEAHKDGSNAFIYSRFLTPYLMNYQGWCIWADGDMVVLDDIAKLWAMRDDRYAVMVVKHDYKTKAPIKYLGNKNEDYPRKNWSSLILWNCGHPANRALTPSFVETATGAELHRFNWLKDDDIGEITSLWNWLAEEYPPNNLAGLVHYTLGTPCFPEYANCAMSGFWWREYQHATEPVTQARPASGRPAVLR